MPDPLDAAFAALGNDQAASLLEDELRRFQYAPELAAMRVLVDGHGPEFFENSVYSQWLAALRTLSPREALAEERLEGLPSVARTEPWGRRLLATQLGSWAELRHDTVAYATQSYTSVIGCEYPDAYVDPYPELFAGIAALLEQLSELEQRLPVGPYLAWDGVDWDGRDVFEYVREFRGVALALEEMARRQREGLPFTEEQLAFINDAVVVETVGCGSTATAGWYTRLCKYPGIATYVDPPVADVHTQPTDAHGDTVGRVLHVGTGFPRLMVVAMDSCEGPRAYIGPVSAYLETVTEDFVRLDDEAWLDALEHDRPPDPWWMEELVTRYPDCAR